MQAVPLASVRHGSFVGAARAATSGSLLSPFILFYILDKDIIGKKEVGLQYISTTGGAEGTTPLSVTAFYA